MILQRRIMQGSFRLAGLLLAAALLAGTSCPGGLLPPEVQVIAPSLDFTVQAGNLVTVVYSASSPGGGVMTVRAYYDRDGVAGTGDEVTFATGLASGESKFVQLSTSGLTAGQIHLAIEAANAAGSAVQYAPGTANVTAGAVGVTFTSPAVDLRIGAGPVVPIEFSPGAGTTGYNYHVFYDTDGAQSGNEITITDGFSTEASVTTSLNTASLAANTYYVGATVTTAGGESLVGYAPGAITIVTEAFVAVLSPTTSIITARGVPVQITVAANDPDAASPTVRVFYDPDNNPANGNDVTIATAPASTTGAVTTWDTSSVSAGVYYIGAELLGVDPPLWSYAAGTVQFYSAGAAAGGPGAEDSALLTMGQPLADVNVVQGRIYTIRWKTDLRLGEGTIEVFREPDFNLDGMPDGALARVVISAPGLDAATQRLDFDTTRLAGTFFFGGTVTPNTGDPATDHSEGRVTILPAVVWVGHLTTKYDEDGEPLPLSGPLEGATFRGHNIGDNLGSAMMEADDYDGDGVNDVVLAAQFGKPWFIAQDGRGAGEAYMVYGRSGERLLGSVEVNNVGAENLPGGSTAVPGTIFTGIVPSPRVWNDPTSQGLAGTSIPYTVDGVPAPPFASEGLRSMTLISDQDNDGRRELVFGFPYCNSYSLSWQAVDGFHPAPTIGLGRLENNGHFLRGGVVIVSSFNPLLASRTARSRHVDRVLELHEVGQHFTPMDYEPNFPAYWGPQDNCPPGAPDGAIDTVTFPCDGFWQDTLYDIDPPRLVDPVDAFGLIIHPDFDTYGCRTIAPFNHRIYLSQIDSPPPPGTIAFPGGMINDYPPFSCDAYWPPVGSMEILGTGFYSTGNSCSRAMAAPDPPYGCRILGQTTTQPLATPPTTANRFAHSISPSGDFLLIGAPLRTVQQRHVTILPTPDREECGEIYMLQFKRPGVDPSYFAWALPDVTVSDTIPYPHNYIIEDLGYTRYGPGCSPVGAFLNDTTWEVSHPFHIVGAAPGDHIGEVTGLADINHDGVEDFAVGGPQTNGSRGSVYVIYRRAPEVEWDYLLERLQLNPNNLNRLNGLYIVGREGEQLGTSIGGVSALGDDLNDAGFANMLIDFNDDGFADMLIGSPNATSAGGYRAGEVLVLFGGRNLLSPEGGTTIPALRDAGDGMVIGGAQAYGRAGETVANAGDVDGDGVADILIAAPDASPRYDSNGDGVPDAIGVDYNGDLDADDLDGDGTPDDLAGAGLVYLVFGGRHLTGTIGLDQIGTRNLPGIVFVGRKAGDHLGGGLTQGGMLSRGVAAAGDLDDDQQADFFISAVLADPEGKTDAGEIYLIYGAEEWNLGNPQ